MEETKENPKEELTFLDQVEQERKAFELVREDTKKLIAEFKELKAMEIMSGKTDAGQASEKVEEEDPRDYAKRALSGKL